MKTQFNRNDIRHGTAPGIEHDEILDHPSGNERAVITCIDYSPAHVSIQEIDQLDEFLAQHRPDWSAVRWISVVGLSDMNAVHALATKYDLHPLAAEDVLHARQRPKVETYGGEESEFLARLFIVTRMLYIQDGCLQHEQLSIFLGHKTVLTFQESPGDSWDLIHQRIKAKGSRLRGNDASFLAYSLLDTVIDSCFPILEQYSDRAEELESLILEDSKPKLLNEIHQLKPDLLLIRWVVWPMREVVQALQRDPHECMSDITRVYLRDLYDHVIQIIEIIETYREIASDLTDTPCRPRPRQVPLLRSHSRPSIAGAAVPGDRMACGQGMGRDISQEVGGSVIMWFVKLSPSGRMLCGERITNHGTVNERHEIVVDGPIVGEGISPGWLSETEVVYANGREVRWWNTTLGKTGVLATLDKPINRLITDLDGGSAAWHGNDDWTWQIPTPRPPAPAIEYRYADEARNPFVFRTNST